MSKQWLAQLMQSRDLEAAQMEAMMHSIMSGSEPPAMIGALLVALRMKGETVQEISAAVRVMRELMVPVPVSRSDLVDSCGTGGDGKHLFNISTGAAFVAAAGGAAVAKHGNRAASGNSGSADVLEELGVPLSLSVEQVSRCIDELGVGFIFAPHHHQAVKHVAGVRKELGVPTLFNLLGPLCNPAGVRRQVLGVPAAKWLPLLIEVARELGSEQVLVVSSEDGLDEISCAAPTRVAELKNGELSEYTIEPRDYGFDRHSLNDLVVESPAQSAELLRAALRGQHANATAMLALNGGAALYAAGVCKNLKQGVALATDVIASGQAAEKMNQYVTLSRAMAGVESSE